MTDNDDDGQAVSAATPDAPWGVNPRTGRPYKVDPSKMRALRSLRGGGRKADAPRGPGERQQGAPKPPGGVKTAAHYAGRIRKWLRHITRIVGARNTVDGLILTSQAQAMADAWGQVAIDYPKVGRALDRLGKGGSLSEAVAATVLTAGMIAANHGVIPSPALQQFFGSALEEMLVVAGLATPREEPEAA